ncbi:MAG: FxsA family protein [Nocardioides sp.]
MTPSPAARPRRRRWPWLLLLAFVVMPVLEIYVIIQVGQVIGAWWTVLLLIADAFLGSWLVKREGGRAWAALREALASGRMPARELADGVLIVIGGTLMISPGFVTDLVGFALILPFTRPAARRVLTAIVARRLVVVPSGAAGNATRPGAGRGPVVQGEVVDDDQR